MLLSVEDQKKMIQDEDVKLCFLRREDIASLSVEDQETRWQAHLKGLNNFRALLASLDAVVV
jgi:hypothetical protein